MEATADWSDLPATKEVYLVIFSSFTQVTATFAKCNNGEN